MHTECPNTAEHVTPTTVVVPADAGTVLNAFGSALQLKLSAAQTNGSLGVSLATIPPGYGPPPHMHHEEDELFLILEGRFRFVQDGQWTQDYGAGTLVYAPRGIVHTFQNAGDTPGRFWGFASSGGFERFFARCADVFAQPGPPDMERIVAISTEHGIEYVPPLMEGAPYWSERLETAPAASATVVVPAGQGTVLNAFGDSVQIKLGGEQTNGSVVVFLDTVPPGGGPPPHMHHDEDELFLIQDGRFRFLTNGQWTQSLGAGTLVYAPRGTVHAFQNTADTPSRFWGITTPSGFDQFFDRCADVFARPEPPDMERIVAISAEHGIEYVPPVRGSGPA